MKNRKKQIKILALALVILTLVLIPLSCKVADLRTDVMKEASVQDETLQSEKGERLLEAAWKKQGMHHLEKHSTYEFQGNESWRTMMGKMANPWGINNEELNFKYAVNTFDGRVEVLSGKEEGSFFGQQAWQYYTGSEDIRPNFLDKKDKKRAFGLAAFQYFVELPNRLMNAPIKRYAGEREVLGNSYDLVLVTWGEDAKATKEYDQYLCHINKESGLIEIVNYTAHEGHLPGIHYVYATIKYSDFTLIDDVTIAMKHEGFLFNVKDGKKPVHTLDMESFAFDTFPKETLYPDTTLKNYGDEKPVKNEE